MVSLKLLNLYSHHHGIGTVGCLARMGIITQQYYWEGHALMTSVLSDLRGEAQETASVLAMFKPWPFSVEGSTPYLAKISMVTFFLTEE